MYIAATSLGNLLTLLLMDFVFVHFYAVQSSYLKQVTLTFAGRIPPILADMICVQPPIRTVLCKL